MVEQRQLPRWEIKQKVRVWMPQTQDFSHCMIEDMHLKGMRVSLNKRLPQPGPVKMSFAMGNNFNPIDIEAQVSWAKEDQGSYRYGLSFSKINDEDKDRIYRFISTICYDQFRKKWWA